MRVPFMLVNQPAADLAASYSRRKVGDRGRDVVIVIWWPQAPGPVRSVTSNRARHD
jgi:hypothetical protein